MFEGHNRDLVTLQDAYYVTCPLHKSIRDDGSGKERKCKKELTVHSGVSNETVIRMLAWWIAAGV